jgi:hypothetical protein
MSMPPAPQPAPPRPPLPAMRRRADLLDAIAAEILALGDGLIETAMRETGLPAPGWR